MVNTSFVSLSVAQSQQNYNAQRQEFQQKCDRGSNFAGFIYPRPRPTGSFLGGGNTPLAEQRPINYRCMTKLQHSSVMNHSKIYGRLNTLHPKNINNIKLQTHKTISRDRCSNIDTFREETQGCSSRVFPKTISFQGISAA